MKLGGWWWVAVGNGAGILRVSRKFSLTQFFDFIEFDFLMV